MGESIQHRGCTKNSIRLVVLSALQYDVVYTRGVSPGFYLYCTLALETVINTRKHEILLSLLVKKRNFLR